jgi:hypothetical protein
VGSIPTSGINGDSDVRATADEEGRAGRLPLPFPFSIPTREPLTTARARVNHSPIARQAPADFEASANMVFQSSRWVAVMTLLRTVGLVLKDVDRMAAASDVPRRIDDAWDRLEHEKTQPRTAAVHL